MITSTVLSKIIWLIKLDLIEFRAIPSIFFLAYHMENCWNSCCIWSWPPDPLEPAKLAVWRKPPPLLFPSRSPPFSDALLFGLRWEYLNQHFSWLWPSFLQYVHFSPSDLKLGFWGAILFLRLLGGWVYSSLRFFWVAVTTALWWPLFLWRLIFWILFFLWYQVLPSIFSVSSQSQLKLKIKDLLCVTVWSRRELEDI